MEQRRPNRAQIADAVAARALGLAPGDNRLTSRQWGKYRTLYSQAYMAQHADPVLIEPSCTCPHRPYPHTHSAEERERERNRFAWHLKQGRQQERTS